MKTASVQHLDTLVNNRIYSSYHIDFKLTHLADYIMNKLSNVSPFLLLLLPVFLMTVATLSSSLSKNTPAEAALKSSPRTEVAKISSPLLK